MVDCAALEQRLTTAQKVLDVLEEQAAGYTSLTIPAHLKVELEEKRQEVANLKEQLGDARQATQNGISRKSPMRSRVPDEHYIERDKAKRLLENFSNALRKPEKHPLLFNIYGIGGVGKTTLRDRLQEAYADEVDFLGVCFAKTPDIETPLKLMRKLHQQAMELSGVETSTDPFAQKEQKFETTLFELSRQSVDGNENSSEDARKITSWFERFIWLGSAGFTSASSKPKSYDSPLAAIGEDAEGLQEWIQQRVRNHPVTKDQPELQTLMLEPVSKLTQAFAESLMQIAQRRGRSLVLILDTFEKAQAYLNQWLWQYLVEDTTLYAAPVRLVVVGRRSLQADEGWRKLNQDRKLLYETFLERFDKKETDKYLQQIGIQNGGTRSKIYKVTQGLPEYLDWVRKQREKGEEPDFSQGNKAIADLLLQGIHSQQRQRQRKILQVVACCRWFDLAMIRYLLRNVSPELQQDFDQAESYFEWLKQSDFVEFSKGRYRLDDVARDVFRQSYFQDDQNRFRKTNALLADYFKQWADETFEPQSLLPDPYEDDEWRELTAEMLYYSLLGKGRQGLQQYIEQVFVAAFLREPDIFIAPFAFVRAEINEENQDLLPKATGKFFKDSAIGLGFGWFFLGKLPKSYKLKFEGEDDLAEEVIEARLERIEDSLQALLEYVGNLQDGFTKCVGLMYKSLRCNRHREMVDSLLQAKSQAEQLSTHCRPKLLHSLLLNLGNLLNGVDYYQDSLDCCEKALEIWQGNALAFLYQGYALGNLKRYEEALESFQKALSIDSQSVNAWIYRGIALGDLNRYEEALESFQKALDVDSQSVDVWMNRGIALDHLERYEEALKSFQKALDIDPKSVDAWTHRGIALQKLKQFEQSLIACDRGVGIDPESSDALNSQALALSFLKDFDRAIAAIDKAISLKPEEVLYKANRGIVLARASRYAEALAECEKAIQLDSQHESGYYAKACYYALQGEIEQVIDPLQKAIEIEPGHSRREAKYNPDFDSMRHDERFRALVYPEPNH